MSINVKDTDKWVSVDVDYSKIAAKLASSKQIELVGDVEGRIEDSSNVETGEVYTGFDGSRDVQIIVTYNPDSIAPAATNDSEGNLITDTYLKRSGGDIFGDVNFKLTKDAEIAELTITKEGNVTGHSISLDGTLTSVNINNSNNFTSKNANIDNIISNVEINSNEAFSSSIGNTTPFNIIKAKKIELLTTATSSGIVLDATTGVMNIAPSVTNTGSIGTFSNVWSDGYFNNLHATNIVGNFTESISFTNISNNVVSYNGSESIDLSDGIYYAVNAFQLSAQRNFSLINGATGSTTSNLDNGLTIDVTDLDSRKLRNTVNTAETTFNIIGDISANAATATKLQTPRTFEITGVTSVPQSFDGTENITIPITVVPIDLLSGVLPVEKGGTGVNFIEGVVCGEGSTNFRGCIGGYGYIPKWDETTFGIEESEIFETEDLKIGIGTSSPTHKLDVIGDGNFNGDLSLSITDTSTSRFLTFYNNNENKFDWQLGISGDYFILQNNSNSDIFENPAVQFTTSDNTASFSGNVIPNVDNTLTLGNETNKWANILSYKFNGFVLDNASERKAGILATNVPIIGTDLSTTDNSIVTVDSNGYLKTVDILSTDLMRLSTEQIVTGIKRFDNNVEFLSDLYVNVTGEDRFVYIRDNDLTPAEVWRYGYIAEHDDIENMFVLQHYNGASDEYENVVQFSSVSYALEHKGSIYPSDNNTYTIGTTDHQYNNIYSTNFTGHLVGNADTATQLLNNRNFSITGAVTAGAVVFNGTADVVLSATTLDATKLTGLVPKASIPQSVLPTLITVSNESARFALTTSQVKLGDIVKQLDTEQMFYVVDINNLNNNNGYEEFTTAAVDWSTIVNKPNTFTPSAHTHTISDIQGLTTGTAILPSTTNQNNKVLAVYNNAAQWATLTLTGSVTGTATIASSGTISINTTTNHTHSYLPLSGGTLTGNVTSRSITPATTNAYVLGSDTLKWSSVYATAFYGDLTGNVTGNVSGSSGSCTGNAATATQLATARTINGVSFNGTANITVYDSTKLPLSGGTMTGNITIPATAMGWIGGKDSAPIQQDMGTNTSSYFPIIRQRQNTVTYNIGGQNNQFGIYMYQNSRTANGTDASLIMNNSGNIIASGTLTASRVYNAVYNDYAECFNNTNLIYNEVLHRIVEIDDNECVRLASKNSYRVIGVVSDNYGHLLGGLEEDIESGKKIPVGLAGTLYVYTLDEINTKNIGKLVCADNNGYATLADKDSEGTIVGKIIGFNKEYHQYKVLLILK